MTNDESPGAAARDRVRVLEDMLKASAQSKDEFLSSLAHELRNPLAPIQNATLILRSDAATDETRRYALDVVDRQVRQLAQLVDDLMDLSHASAGRLELHRRIVDLRDVLRRALESSRAVIERAGHEFTLTLPPTPIVVNADPARLAQVVANLLNNAAKYTERGGQIALAARAERGDAIIAVRDSGIGIAPEDVGRIFDLFAQGAPAWPHSHHGLGIGLTLARCLVDLHGGALVAVSQGPGCGSEFTVRLPLSEAPVDGAESGRTSDARIPGVRVLVVDDNIDAAETLAMFLEFKGHTVRICHEGPTALAMADQYRPDVLLLDIGLPGMNGCDVARTLRQRLWAEATTIIALSGWNEERDREASRAAGINHHLVKPVDHGMLEKLLSQVTTNN